VLTKAVIGPVPSYLNPIHNLFVFDSWDTYIYMEMLPLKECSHSAVDMISVSTMAVQDLDHFEF